MLRTVLVIIGLLAFFYALLWVFQERLIYFPRRYAFAPDQLPAPLVAVRYSTEAGVQTAFYVPPPSGRRVRLWLVFGGNAMTALDWLWWVAEHPDRDAAFLLVDYPGYGFSAGRPSRQSIAEASDAAFAALAALLQVPPEQLARETSLLGHSLGAAVALEFATRHRPKALVLTAPFTRLADVAARFYGPWIRPMVRERYDNLARLAELAAERPPIVILHGRDDEVIAFDFGRQLAASAPWARFVPLDRVRHNDVYDLAAREVREAMRIAD